MPSQEAVELAAKVVTITTGAAGTAKGGPEGGLIQFLAAQIDVAIDLVAKNGKMSSGQLEIVLIQKGLSFTNVVPIDTVQCVGSLASLGAGFAAVAISVPTGPLGWTATGLNTLGNLYSTYGSCNKPVRELSEAAQKKTLGLAAQFTAEFWDWVRANGGMVPPTY